MKRTPPRMARRRNTKAIACIGFGLRLSRQSAAPQEMMAGYLQGLMLGLVAARLDRKLASQVAQHIVASHRPLRAPRNELSFCSTLVGGRDLSRQAVGRIGLRLLRFRNYLPH